MNLRVLCIGCGWLALALALLAGNGPALRHKTETVQSPGARVAIEEFASPDTGSGNAVVFLYGSGGLHRTAFQYMKLARLVAGTGRLVYLPHYLDVTHGDSAEPERHYGAWATAVRDSLQMIEARNGIAASRIVIVGTHWERRSLWRWRRRRLDWRESWSGAAACRTRIGMSKSCRLC